MIRLLRQADFLCPKAANAAERLTAGQASVRGELRKYAI